MSLTVGFPPHLARIPSAWRDALPGMDVVSGPGAKELLDALRSGDLDAVVAEAGGTTPDGLSPGAVPLRVEPRDVLVPAEGTPTLASLPEGARVALAGRRRRALLAVHRPDLEPVGLPGDQERTVAPFLRGGGADAAIVAAHAARAAGISDDASQVLDPKEWLPSPGQGARVLLVRSGDAATWEALAALDDPSTRAALEAEGSLAGTLGMGPDSVLGALALPYGRWLRLWAMIPDVNGRRMVRGDRSGNDGEPDALGRAMARLLLDRGADLLPGVTVQHRTDEPDSSRGRSRL